ncbi:hydrolase-like protein [Leishmania major strain Friedlin]|uniref:Hydrolase-like protein n=1 Tax=Leishmania major TaxID=5664 RepID=Q4QE85_LEIMA|nr:hydrolase-like protein [Leishmania major strain Friedlin]CAG9572339.1 esterase-like_protein [Leishmania major strain Friedlin]CAJ03820.1 hydrolase-like protein [Leishmania major strain Friedlin]|eukprot:XP_001682363.1 hydrolase-like protein [Leishmania major strain Friedlin]
MVVRVRDCPASQMQIDICYQCFGNPDDGLPAVLLIGGLNMQLTAWDESFCESLVYAGFYVIRYDNRDIGYSTKIENCGKIKAPMLLLPGRAAKWLGEELPYQLEDMAADAWALLDALHIPCAHLFGISMGGMIAQLAALQAPERTMSLTSVMSSTNAPDLPEPELWVKLWMLRWPPRNCTVDELLEFRVHSLRHLLRYALPPDGEYLKRRFLMSLRRSSYADGLVRQAAAIRRAAGRDALLQQLHVPALVVHGVHDVVVPPMNGYRTATMLPYARLLVLKSMGHYFHPAFFSTIIAVFVDMAASTDPAKRHLRPVLPITSGDSADDRGAGGKSASVEELGACDYEDEPSGEPGDAIDPKTRMMASLGEYIVPVVADAESPIGKAVCRSVMVAIPGGNSNPAVPEAVIVENLFQRDPYAAVSVPTPAIAKRPVPSSSPQSAKQRAAPAVSTGDGLMIASLRDARRKVQRSSSRAAKLRSSPPPSRMEGAKPFVSCSPSRWHELEPFPQRRAAAAAVGGAGISELSRGGRPSAEKTATGFPGSFSSASSSVAALAVETPACSAVKAAEAAEAPLWHRLPRFHPVVAGVTVEEYLRTHPTAPKGSGIIPATAAGSTAVAGAGRASETAAAVQANDDATLSVSAANGAVAPRDAALAASPMAPTVAVTGGGAVTVKAAHDESPSLSPASRVSSEERRADEAFLHSEAPQDVVKASSFTSL